MSGRLYPQVEPKIFPECEARAGDFLFSAAKSVRESGSSAYLEKVFIGRVSGLVHSFFL